MLGGGKWQGGKSGHANFKQWEVEVGPIKLLRLLQQVRLLPFDYLMPGILFRIFSWIRRAANCLVFNVITNLHLSLKKTAMYETLDRIMRIPEFSVKWYSYIFFLYFFLGQNLNRSQTMMMKWLLAVRSYIIITQKSLKRY